MAKEPKKIKKVKGTEVVKKAKSVKVAKVKKKEVAEVNTGDSLTGVVSGLVTKPVITDGYQLKGQNYANVAPQDLAEFSQAALREYGSYVVEDRAVADFRDGLKPSHRAIIWSMCDLGLRSSAGHKKAARTVGQGIGMYHPHGDTSLYGAMVTIANTIPPAVDGQGNWGTPTDGAAAMRYCFVGNTRISTEEGLVRIDMIPEELDPEVIRGQALFTDGYKIEADREYLVSSLDEQLPVSHWINSGKHKTKAVTTDLGSYVECTANQPFYVLRGSEFVWVTASDLMLGDRVCVKHETRLNPTSGKELPDFIQKKTAHGSVLYLDGQLPTHMSEDLAFVVGALVAEGCSRKGHGFSFMNTCPEYYGEFKRAFNSVFDVDVEERLKPPHSYGKLDCMYFSAKYSIMNQYSTEVLGIKWKSQNQVVPDTIFRASRSEVVAFLRALFEGDGSVFKSEILLHSTSTQLLRDVKLLLASYFGILSKVRGTKLTLLGPKAIIAFAENVGFFSARKKLSLKESVAISKRKLVEMNCGGGFTLDDVPVETIRAIKEEFRSKYVTGMRTMNAEDGTELSTHNGNQKCFARFFGFGRSAKIPRSRKRLVEWCNTHFDDANKYWPELAAKFKRIIMSDYFYDKVVSVEDGKTRWVYDLTVPETHAFVANGIVAHNTESKLSIFASMFLVDRKYLEVVPMVANYSNDGKIPLYMPALLPYLLYNGSVPAPAYGVKAGNPTFSFESVANTVIHALEGKEIDSKYLQKNLKIEHEYGCDNVTTPEEFKALVETGRGRVTYRGRVSVDVKNRIIIIHTFVPAGFASSATINKTLEKLSLISGVSKAYSNCGLKNKDAGAWGAAYEVKCGRVSEDRLYEIARDVERQVTNSVSYALGVTIRKESDANEFRYLDYVKYFKAWITYRLKLEVRLNKDLKEKAEREKHILEVYLFAVDNIKKLLAALPKVLASADPDKTLAKTLKMDVDDAKIILDRQVRKLAKLERDDLVKAINKLKADIKQYSANIKDPGTAAALDTKARVSAYLKNLDKHPYNAKEKIFCYRPENQDKKKTKKKSKK